MKKWKKAVFQCMLGMATLLLFVPQLSFKFYLCANPPTLRAHAAIVHARTSGSPITRRYEHCRPLSIDKRYDLKQLFALPPVVCETVRTGQHVPAYTAYPAPGIHPDAWATCPPLRGPPQLSFHS